VRISSAGKTFSATGWKIGWALAMPELISEVTAVKQFLSYVSGAPFQPAVARALNEGDEWVEKARLTSRTGATSWPQACGQSTRADRAAWHLLHDHRRPAPVTPTACSSVESSPPAAESSRSPSGVLRPDGGGQTVRAVGLLQAGTGARRGDPEVGSLADEFALSLEGRPAHNRSRLGSGDCSTSSSLNGAESASSCFSCCVSTRYGKVAFPHGRDAGVRQRWRRPR
jgi:hypothetical protein